MARSVAASATGFAIAAARAARWSAESSGICAAGGQPVRELRGAVADLRRAGRHLCRSVRDGRRAGRQRCSTPGGVGRAGRDTVRARGQRGRAGGQGVGRAGQSPEPVVQRRRAGGDLGRTRVQRLQLGGERARVCRAQRRQERAGGSVARGRLGGQVGDDLRGHRADRADRRVHPVGDLLRAVGQRGAGCVRRPGARGEPGCPVGQRGAARRDLRRARAQRGRAGRQRRGAVARLPGPGGHLARPVAELRRRVAQRDRSVGRLHHPGARRTQPDEHLVDGLPARGRGNRVAHLCHRRAAERRADEGVGVVVGDVDPRTGGCVAARRRERRGEVGRDGDREVVVAVAHARRRVRGVGHVPVERVVARQLVGQVRAGSQACPVGAGGGRVGVHQGDGQPVEVGRRAPERPQVQRAVEQRDEQHRGDGEPGESSAAEPAELGARGEGEHADP